MTALGCFAKALGMTFLAFVALFVIGLVLLVLGLPVATTQLVLLAGLTVVGYVVAAHQLESEHPGLWAVAVFFFGLIAFLVLWYRYERQQAGMWKVVPALGDGPGPSDVTGAFGPLGDPRASSWAR